MNEVKYIKSRLTETERLLGLTEEALELALSALKLRRVMDGTNPTPVTLEQATANLLEEFGDVLNTVEVLVTPTQNELAMQLRQTKRTRWVERLKAAGPEPLVVEHRQQRCPHCGWTWWEDCDATDYPNYCPQCGGELHGGWTVTEPEEEKKRGGWHQWRLNAATSSMWAAVMPPVASNVRAVPLSWFPTIRTTSTARQ